MKLVVIKHGKQILEQVLEEGQEYLIGRDKQCHIVLEAEHDISRQHFKIYQSPESQLWTIECISSHGSKLYVEGEELEGVELEGSLDISFKHYTFQFIDEDTQQKEPTASSSSIATGNKTLNKRITTTQTRSLTKIVLENDLSYSLCISMEGESPEFISLNHEASWVIGRGENCDISIDHPNLSNKHLFIERKESQFFISDLGSSNGTLLNEKTLKHNVPELLKSEDRIIIASLELKFEVQNKKFKALMSNLPTLPPDSNEGEVLPEGMVIPKVVLEETPESTDTSKENKTPKKRLVFFGVVAVVLGLGLFLFSSNKSKKETEQLTTKQIELEKKQKLIESHYLTAQRLFQQKNHASCIDELTKLHELVPAYRDSQSIFTQCENGIIAKKRIEEDELRRRQALETEEKVTELIQNCYDKKEQFESLQDANQCLSKAIELDPTHALISKLQAEFKEKESLKLLEEEEKKAYLDRVAKIRVKYTVAKRKHKAAEKSKDPNRILNVAHFYDAFVKASAKEPSLRKLRNLSKQEALNIRNHYKTTLDDLHAKCKTLIDNKKMKEAYSVCKNVLDFKEDDPKTLEWMEMAKKSLRDRLKSKYEESVLKESISDVAKAKTLWKEILQTDIETGHYYQKAQSKLKKYK